MRAEPTGFSNGLDIRVKGIGIKDEAIIFALYVLSSWKEGSAIKRVRDSQGDRLRRTGPRAENRDM